MEHRGTTVGEVDSWPANAGDLTAEWLSAALSGWAKRAVEVSSFASLRIGTGQVGECWRLELKYERGQEATLPSSVVAKFASTDPVSRQAGASQQCYVKEVGFYRDIQSKVLTRTPVCYYSSIADNGIDHVLLLEDIGDAAAGDQLTGCTPAQAQSALREVALLHGPVWEDPFLESLSWLQRPGDEYREHVLGLFASCAEPFLQRFGDRVDEDSRSVVEWIAEHQSDLITQPTSRTVCHQDFRVDNLLFGAAAEEDQPPRQRVTVVDWQTLSLGAGPQDVAYLLGGSLPIAERRKHERDLLRAYHQTLENFDIGAYDFEKCFADYRRCTTGGVLMAVISAILVGSTERGDAMFLAMLRRHARHFLDLDTRSVLI